MVGVTTEPHGCSRGSRTMLRIGFLVSPPLVGAQADATSLRVALLTVVLAGVGALVLGRALPGRAAGQPAA
jgi:hypothetical protein